MNVAAIQRAFSARGYDTWTHCWQQFTVNGFLKCISFVLQTAA
jgi:hypothetical protein